MTDAERLARAIPFLPQLSEKAREGLAGGLRVHQAPPRATLLQPGDRVSGAYFVEAGSIRVYYLDEQGREGTLYRIEPGQSCVLSLNCLFAAMDYPAWAEAGEEGVTFYELDGGTARELMRQDHAFTEAIFLQVSTRLYGVLEAMEKAIRLSLEGRLVNLLLDLADEDGTVRLSHERLGGHLGTSREVVTRLVRNLVSDGLVESAYGRIELRDREALRSRAD